MNIIAVTGASGFIGRAFCAALLVNGFSVRAAVRYFGSLPLTDGLQEVEIGEADGETDWSSTLVDVNCVFHCMAHTYMTCKHGAGALAAYRKVNVESTLRLARQAASAGVQRFVFLSSIKVNGEITLSGQAFTEKNVLAPKDDYALSKAEAEQALFDLARQTGMEVVVIRPPLVVGPGVKGNLASIIKLVQRGIPLPLGSVHNQRSLVALDNLVSLMLLCADPAQSTQAANQVFLVADGKDISITTLLHKVARAAGCPNRLLPVPPRLLRVTANLLGKNAIVHRLLDNLQVDATKARELLGWRPSVSIDEQLDKMFIKHKQGS
jgi:nucleoside-diphosphate-sugar epimerase